MISNITYKAIAYMQLSMHEQLQTFAQTHPRTSVPVAFFVCAADVAIETIKYPIAAIESVAFSAINAVGSLYFKECSLLDAYQEIKIAGSMLGATALRPIALPLNFLRCLLFNLPDPKNAHSCNKEADKQANFPAIAYDSKECRALQSAVKNESLTVIEKLLGNNKLTHQSIGRVLEDAAENGRYDIMPLLLADSRLIQQSIDSALEKASKNYHTNIMSILIEKLTQLISDKYHLDEGISPLNSRLIQQSIDGALENASKNGYYKIMLSLMEELTLLISDKYQTNKGFSTPDSRLIYQSIDRALKNASKNAPWIMLSLMEEPILLNKGGQKNKLFISICLSKAKEIAI